MTVIDAFLVGLSEWALAVVVFVLVALAVRSQRQPVAATAPAQTAPALVQTAGLLAGTATPADRASVVAEGGNAEPRGGEGESPAAALGRSMVAAAPKKSAITPAMLDTANSYDDKVLLVRMLVSEDSGRVAAILKKMIQRDR